MTTSAMESRQGARRDATPRLGGWAITAASLLLVTGGFNIVEGYTLLERKSYLDNTHIIYSNLNFWGWLFLVWGVLQIVAGALVFAHRPAGVVMGVSLATTACFLWFFMLFVAPFGMLVGIAVNSLIIFGLTAGAPERYHSVYD